MSVDTKEPVRALLQVKNISNYIKKNFKGGKEMCSDQHNLETENWCLLQSHIREEKMVSHNHRLSPNGA